MYYSKMIHLPPDCDGEIIARPDNCVLGLLVSVSLNISLQCLCHVTKYQPIRDWFILKINQ